MFDRLAAPLKAATALTAVGCGPAAAQPATLSTMPFDSFQVAWFAALLGAIGFAVATAGALIRRGRGPRTTRCGSPPKPRT